MKTLRKALLTTVTAGLMAAGATAANAAPFDITDVTLLFGSGYDTVGGHTDNLLDINYNKTFTAQNFSLLPAGTHSFDIGTFTLQEGTPYGEGGIYELPNINGYDETDNLDVTAVFTFVDPLAGLQNILATGTAYAGAAYDAAVDYTLVWTDPVLVAFGNGGLFSISLNDITLNSNGQIDGTDTLQATIALRTDSIDVPEPATLGLMGVGLAGIGFVSRRRKKAC